jgi:Arylsulfotransferase (ASST)
LGPREQETSGNAINDEATFRPNRRAVLRGGLGAAGCTLVAASDAHAATFRARGTSWSTQLLARSSFVTEQEIAVFPLPNSRTASPDTEITFRLAELNSLGQVTVIGAESGNHSGLLVPHADGNGASFIPDSPFQPGESVRVEARIPLRAGSDGSLTFTVSRRAPAAKVPEPRESEDSIAELQSFRSRPNLHPPAITVTTPAPDMASGFIFVGPRTPGGQNGQMILDNRGELIWFFPAASEAETVTDFKVQQYRGQPVLTWWEGASTQGHGFGHFALRDQAYHKIAMIQVGNGYDGGDLHEFRLSPQDTALVGVYNPLRWDLSSVGGPKDGVVLDGIVQELEVETGRVLFEWHSIDHIDLEESHIDPPSSVEDPFDFLHLNSIEIDNDGNLIVSGRHTWAAYKIDRRTGEVIWRLGGKKSSFAMGEGTAFAYQHDARVHDNSNFSLFDNRADSDDANVASRGVVLNLNTDAMTATLVTEYVHPTEILSVSQGNLQMLPNGNAFIGWGSAPVFSEFDADGNLRFNGRFPKGGSSYRAYSFSWKGQPTTEPAIAVELESGTEATIYASWNGATEVATWQVLAGQEPDQMQHIGDAPRSGFETAITAQTEVPYLAVQAQDGSGNVLGVSAAIRSSK